MIQLALIGAGAWGKNYLTTVKKISGCKITYICAQSAKSLEPFKKEYQTLTNFRDLFSCPDIDGVIIATPNGTHYQIIQEFLKRGVPVLVEKPLVENFLHAKKLQILHQKSKSNVLVGHNYLFDPSYREAKKLVKQIGKIRYLAYEGTNNGPFRKDTSALWDIGPHAVSLCLDVLQKTPRSVSAWAIDSITKKKGFYDFCYIKITFEDNIEAFIKISWLFPLKKRELVIVGEKDTVMYDAVAEKKVIYYKDMIPGKQDRELRKNLTSVSYPGYESKTSLEVEVEEFVDAIKKKGKIHYSGLEFSVLVTKILSLAEKSIRQNGRPMKI